MKPSEINFSAPAVTLKTGRTGPFAGNQSEPVSSSPGEPKKRLDYTHLDIIAVAERVTGRSLKQHTKTSGKFTCQCPFEGCTSKNDAFLVFDRPELEEGQVHWWCNACGKRGSLMDLVMLMFEQEHNEKPTWETACEVLEIDPRTWRQKVEGEEAEQTTPRQNSGREKRRQQAEQQRKAALAELQTLDAIYHLAHSWLAAGRITMKDGTQIALDVARAYLQERGYTLQQAGEIGMAYIPTSREVPELADKISSRWRGRIVFPMDGPKGARGYAGRSLWRWKPGMTAEQHKKLFEEWNTAHPETPVARHMKTRQAAFYGYEQAQSASILVIVEGEFDAASVRLALVNMPDIAVMAMGKNFDARQVPLTILHVILAMDTDQAGQSAIESQQSELEIRGVSVTLARPPAGKDWNDCHIQAGLGTIRLSIAQACPPWSHPSAYVDRLENVPAAPVPIPANPNICACGEPSFVIDEQNHGYCKACYRAAGHLPGPGEGCIVCGDFLDTIDDNEQPYCYPCLQRVRDQQEAEQQQTSVLGQIQQVFQDWAGEGIALTLLPVGMPTEEYIARYMRGERPGQVLTGDVPTKVVQPESQGTQRGFSAVSHKCPKHGRTLQYGDELGGRYCDHVDCWERYRLVRSGAKQGYPALHGVVDKRTAADTSKPPLYYITMPATGEQVPVYADRPPITALLIESGADAWHTYTRERDYHAIDQAIRALTGH